MNWREIIFAATCFGITSFNKPLIECVFGVWGVAIVLWVVTWLPNTAHPTHLHEACAQLTYIGINLMVLSLLWKLHREDVAWACSTAAALRLHWGNTALGHCVVVIWTLVVPTVACTHCAAHINRETVVLGLLWPPIANTLNNQIKKFIQGM